MDILHSGTWKVEKSWLVRLICEQCESVLEARNEDDLESDAFGAYLRCPECGHLHDVSYGISPELLGRLLTIAPLPIA